MLVELLARAIYQQALTMRGCSYGARGRKGRSVSRVGPGNDGFEPEDSYSWCPVFTEIGYDILLGLAKRTGSIDSS
ncbi:unnamed protein product [Effrenium voratum]|nr:unnamed protein product [Effrenium voratum]